MDLSRRRFLKTVTMTGSALALAPALAQAQAPTAPAAAWVVVGKTKAFPLGHTQIVALPPDAGGTSVAVTHASDGTWAALSAVCTHKGCIVAWADDAKQYVCPCHRGRFDAKGKVLAGPPRRALPTYPTRVNADGTLSVQIAA